MARSSAAFGGPVPTARVDATDVRPLQGKALRDWYDSRLPDDAHYKAIVRGRFDAGATVIFIDTEETLPIRAAPNGGHNRCSDDATCAVETKRRLVAFARAQATLD